MEDLLGSSVDGVRIIRQWGTILLRKGKRRRVAKCRRDAHRRVDSRVGVHGDADIETPEYV